LPLLGLVTEWRELEAHLLDQFTADHRLEIAAEFETPFAEAKSVLDALKCTIDDISEWGAHAIATSVLREQGLVAAVEFCVQKRIATADVSAVLRRSALESWVDAVRKSD
jgi:hypothetical protein